MLSGDQELVTELLFKQSIELLQVLDYSNSMKSVALKINY